MKILIMSGYPLSDKVSGSLIHARDLAHHLSEINGMEVHVIAPGKKDEQLSSGNVILHILNHNWFNNPFFIPFTLRTVKRIINEIGPDVIHAMRGYPYCTLAVLLKRKLPVVMSVFSLSQSELQFDKNPVWILLRLLLFIPNERYSIPRIPHIIVQSRLMEDLVRRQTRSEIHIVPEGIELEKLQQYQAQDTLSDSPDIFVAVSFRKLKGMDILIRAVARVKELVPGVKVYIGGSGEEESNLRDLVAELGVDDHVNFLGFISDEQEKYRYYSACKLVVVPSRWDNEPFAALDGAAMGRPVIASNTCNASVVVNGETGYIFENENVEELADCIVKLLKDDTLRSRMGEAIREKVKEYDWGRIAGETVQIYHKALVDFGSRDTQNIGNLNNS
jgi:glycosyltransferase involved in cell wall biosynthesis